MYHINKNGQPSVCHATKQACPLGGEENHFHTQEEALKVSQERFEQELGITPHFDEERVQYFEEYMDSDPEETAKTWNRMTEADKIEAGMRFDFYRDESELNGMVHKYYIKRFNDKYRERQRELIDREKIYEDGFGYIRDKEDADLYSGDFSDMSEKEFKARDDAQKECEETYRMFYVMHNIKLQTFIDNYHPELNKELKTTYEKAAVSKKLYSEFFKGFEEFQKREDPNYDYRSFDYDDELHTKYKNFLSESK